MRQIDVHQAKKQLSKLVEDVAQGEDIIIVKAGKPLARLTAFNSNQQRKRGLLKGKIKIATDFDAPLPNEILAAFEGMGLSRFCGDIVAFKPLLFKNNRT